MTVGRKALGGSISCVQGRIRRQSSAVFSDLLESPPRPWYPRRACATWPRASSSSRPRRSRPRAHNRYVAVPGLSRPTTRATCFTAPACASSAARRARRCTSIPRARHRRTISRSSAAGRSAEPARSRLLMADDSRAPAAAARSRSPAAIRRAGRLTKTLLLWPLLARARPRTYHRPDRGRPRDRRARRRPVSAASQSIPTSRGPRRCSTARPKVVILHELLEACTDPGRDARRARRGATRDDAVRGHV